MPPVLMLTQTLYTEQTSNHLAVSVQFLCRFTDKDNLPKFQTMQLAPLTLVFTVYCKSILAY